MQRETIGIIGGTGHLGLGLALRWARAGHEIIVGSRAPERAQAAVEVLAARVPQARCVPASQEEAAERCTIALVAVPYEHHLEALARVARQVQGKILIDVTVPLVRPRLRRVQLPAGGSACKAAQALLGDAVRVVSAFQNVPAALLQSAASIPHDVLVSGNDPAARERVIALVADAGMRGWHAGPIDNSAAAEALGAVLLFINRQAGIANAGICVVSQDAPGH